MAAWALGPQQYGQLAMMAFVGKMMLVGNFGSVSGYIHRYYDQHQNAVDTRGYLGAYLVHLILVALLAYWVSTFAGKIYSLGVLFFALLIPYFIIEPVLRVRRHFYVSLLPDIVISLAICASLVIARVFKGELRADSLIFLYFVLTLIFLSYLPYLWWICRQWRTLRVDERCRSPIYYLSLVRTGFPMYLGTVGFLLLQFVDRFFLEQFHSPEALGTYMLAYQLASGATLLLTAQNFVAVVDFGELRRDNRSLTTALSRRLKSALIVGALSFLILLGISVFLETHFLESYSGLARNAAALGFGLCLFQIAGSVTPIAFYLRRQTVLTLGMFCLVVLSILHNLFVLQLDLFPLWISAFTGLWLSTYGVMGILFVTRLAKRVTD